MPAANSHQQIHSQVTVVTTPSQPFSMPAATSHQQIVTQPQVMSMVVTAPSQPLQVPAAPSHQQTVVHVYASDYSKSTSSDAYTNLPLTESSLTSIPVITPSWPLWVPAATSHQ